MKILLYTYLYTIRAYILLYEITSIIIRAVRSIFDLYTSKCPNRRSTSDIEVKAK